ncbi:MAG: gentisate 1,2-dioxygenase [Pseudomonadota bacterium]
MADNIVQARDAYYERLKPHSLAPLWTVLDALVTETPASTAAPFAWSFSEIRPMLMEAGDLISAEEAVRRVLILENPAMPGKASITRTLYAGLQLILPGEIAPCHRHSQSALRFVLEGEGAYTAVDGEQALMRPFDLVLTPNGRWHDHANESSQPMIWLDGLDIPLVRALDASFAESLSSGAQHPTLLSPGDCQARWGANLKPATGAAADSPKAPLFHYPYEKWRAALATISSNSPLDQCNGTIMEFSNPLDGGPVMPTISAFCQKLPAGFNGKPQRSTDGIIYVGVEGEGRVLIDGEEFFIGPRDVVVAPAWSERTLHAASELTLFSFSDKATQQKLGLWREQQREVDDCPQSS